jgi:hypothetical protein
VQARSTQLVPDKFGIGFGVFEQENADWIGHWAVSTSRGLHL